MKTPASQARLTQLQLLRELQPVTEHNLHRHLAETELWNPRDYVPAEYDSHAPPLSTAARSAMITNLLTEDNVPLGHQHIAGYGRLGEAWGTWIRHWSDEEDRHAQALHGYLVVTRSVDREALERARMQHMSVGIESALEGSNLLHSLAHVTFQELATKVSHRNASRLCNNPDADRLLAQIARDEDLHMIFYRNLCQAALEIAPDQAAKAIGEVVMNFRIPGRARAMVGRRTALAPDPRVYDLRQHLDDVLAPILHEWDFFDRNDFGPEGEAARDSLAEFVTNLELTLAHSPHPG